jgi:dihydrofolate synthase/folylpolyglutamate synthase
MRGPFQHDNAAAAVAAIRVLREQLPVPVSAIRAGLQRARLPGRFQVVPGAVTWILDVAHNGEAAQALASNLRAFTCGGRMHAVVAVLGDKSPEGVVGPLMPFVGAWYLTQSDDPRTMPADVLSARLAPLLSAPAVVATDLRIALDAVAAAAEPGDCVLVVGSFTTVAAGLRHVEACGAPEGP